MTAATICLCTLAPLNALDLELSAKARRSATKSWRIAVPANLRRTISAPPADLAGGCAALQTRGFPRDKEAALSERGLFCVVTTTGQFCGQVFSALKQGNRLH